MNYLTEAFKSLDILDEDVFTADEDGIKELKDFQDSEDEEVSIDVVDPEAETEEDIEDSYVGQVILKCSVCQTDSYKDKSEVEIDEESELANVGEECPFCFSSSGFHIVGEVAPFVEVDVDAEDEAGEEVDVDVDIEDKVEESLKRKRSIKEAKKSTQLDVSSNKSSTSKVLKDTMDKWSSMTKVKDIVDFVKSEFEKADLDTEGSRKILARVSASKSVSKAIETLTNSMMDGMRLSMRRGTGKKNESIKNKKWHNKMLESIEVTVEISDAYELYDRCWSGARDTVNACIEADMGEDLILLLEDVFGNSTPTMTDINDFLWANDDDIFEQLGIDPYGENAELEESIKNRKQHRRNRHFREAIENVDVDTGDQIIHVTTEEKNEPVSGDEMIVPLSPESEDEIVGNTAEEAPEEEEVDVDFDEVPEEELDELGESYFKKVYSNVKSYKTTLLKQVNESLIVEGIIKFASGKSKKTSFKFTPSTITRNGTAKLLGENLQISRGKKSFVLTGTLKEGLFTPKSLRYNYRAKGNDGKSTRVYGTVLR